MNTRERFGNYLLLKKLSEDPLGEVFRAGRIGGEGVEQVLLLRILNGSAVEGVDIEGSLKQRKPLQEVLRSPNIGTGIDAGAYQGVPYIAYDYVSGKDLAALMSQALRKSQPVPPEHALLITERLAMGLAVAHDTRYSGERVTHGFLVPELVVLSNEGEIRVLGFEASRALRASALGGSPLGETFARYLSPESRAGQPPSSSDDVYSLAVILLELLTGRSLSNPSQEGFRPAIERVSSLGFPNVASLIEKSLQPAGSRVGDVVAWHKALDQLVQENNATSTPFHLAFYMHNLFRDDIERESAELESEKTIDFTSEDLQRLLNPDKGAPAQEAPKSTPPAPGAVKPPQPPPPSVDSAPKKAPPPPKDFSTVEAPAVVEQEAPEKRGGGRIALMVAAAVLVLLGGGAALYFFVLNKPAGDAGTRVAATDVQTAQPSASVPDSPPVPTGPTPEEIEQRIQDAVKASQEATEEALRKQSEELVRNLQQQLANAKKQAEDAAKAAEEARLAAERRAQEEQEAKAKEDASAKEEAETELAANATQPAGASVKPPAGAASSDGPSTLPATQQQVAAAQPSQTPVPNPSTTTPRTSPATATQTAQTRPATSTSRIEPSATQPQQVGARTASSGTLGSPVPRPPAPAEERVRQGQLIEASTPGAIKPRPRRRPQPDYPLAAERLGREATVNVIVLVDEFGKVIDAELDGKYQYGFGDAAIKAARQATFYPATKDGVKVKMKAMLTYKFVSKR